MYDPDIAQIERKIEAYDMQMDALLWLISLAQGDDLTDTQQTHLLVAMTMKASAEAAKERAKADLIRHKKSRENARVSY